MKDKLEKFSEFTVVPLIVIIIALLVQSCGNDAHTYDDGYEEGYNAALSDYGIE